MSHKLAAWANLIVIFFFFVFTFIPLFGIPFLAMTIGVILRVYKVGQWWWSPLLIWDIGVNVMTAGSPHNTISARTAYWSIQGCPVAGVMESVINWLFKVFRDEDNHCVKAWRWQVSVGVSPEMEPFPFFHTECETPVTIKMMK